MRFHSLERAGATVAAMSGKADGDCGPWSSSHRARFCAGLGIDHELLPRLRQVHGAVVLDADDAALSPADTHCADAVITRTPGQPVGVSVADCVPVLLAAEGGKAAAAVHAGRQGTLARVAAHTVAALEQRHGVAPETLFAVIGPSAGPCCYEVSPEMADAWRAEGLPAVGRRLDLWRANSMQLAASGVRPERIETAAHCTICGQGFFSYRGDETSARNFAVIVL